MYQLLLCHGGYILDKNNLGKEYFLCIAISEGSCQVGESIMVVGVCGRGLVDKKRGEGEEGIRQDSLLWVCTLFWTFSHQALAATPSHLPTMSSYYESIKGLIYPLVQSPWDLIDSGDTSQTHGDTSFPHLLDCSQFNHTDTIDHQNPRHCLAVYFFPSV